MRTTDVRKLRPESWGFLCPVHTPDGTPCGLLNHLAEPASIVTHYYFDKQRFVLMSFFLFLFDLMISRTASSEQYEKSLHQLMIVHFLRFMVSDLILFPYFSLLFSPFSVFSLFRITINNLII